MGEPKLLFYDIETSPNLAYVWGKYEQDVLAYEHEWYLLCFAYKWLGDKKVTVVSLPDFPKTYKKDHTNDIELVKILHNLFDEAEIIIAHNGDRFDEKKVNARFAYHSMTPPSPSQTIDTLKVARKYLGVNSHKLNDLGIYLKVGKKLVHTGFDLWYRCMMGDPTAWKLMKRYNQQDVILLEKVYLKLRPWDRSHPSLALLSGKLSSCPRCGGKVQARGYRLSKTMRYRRFQCKSCGSWSRSVASIKEERPLYIN